MGKKADAQVEVTKEELERATEMWEGFLKISKISIVLIAVSLLVLGTLFTDLF